MSGSMKVTNTKYNVGNGHASVTVVKQDENRSYEITITVIIPPKDHDLSTREVGYLMVPTAKKAMEETGRFLEVWKDSLSIW